MSARAGRARGALRAGIPAAQRHSRCSGHGTAAAQGTAPLSLARAEPRLQEKGREAAFASLRPALPGDRAGERRCRGTEEHTDTQPRAGERGAAWHGRDSARRAGAGPAQPSAYHLQPPPSSIPASGRFRRRSLPFPFPFLSFPSLPSPSAARGGGSAGAGGEG